MSAFSETLRQIVHIGSAAFALLLPFLSWWQSALLAVLALAFNLFVLPRLGGRALFRAADDVRGYPIGILLYPISVLLLIAAFPRRPDLVAAAWGILAFGDGCATVIGRAVAGRRLGWNDNKTWAGTWAFVVFGAAGGSVLALWARTGMTTPPSVAATVGGTVAAAVAAAFAETVPSRLDDNLSVPAMAALVLWGCSFVEPYGAGALLINRRLLEAVLINAAVAFAGWRAGSVSVSGAAAGTVIGTIIYVGAGRGAWLLLLTSFACAVIASRLKLTRKVLLGIAEERGGRRGPGNAIANCGLAAFAAAVALSTTQRRAALLVCATALIAGASDTVASEIGKGWGRHTYLSTGFRRVRPGTSGAVSLEGTTAGVACSFMLALMAAYGGVIDSSHVWVVVAAVFVGSVVESLLGATLELPGILNNDQLNFINTAVAAGVALALMRPTG